MIQVGDKVEIGHETKNLTGRIRESPSVLVNELVLRPQFEYELQYLLPYYIRIEQVMAREYARLGVLSEKDMLAIVKLLEEIEQKRSIGADPESNMSDILFALEQCVQSRMSRMHQSSSELWHMDRSRNDVQATAQLMFARDALIRVTEHLLDFTEALHFLARNTADLPMPGYTHYQPAQIITAGFYISAMSEQLGRTIRRLLAVFDDIDECPLGSGAMAGLELAWDRTCLAQQLGFSRPGRHALSGVASKEWMLHIAAELSTLGVALSRFATDFISWGSSGYHFIDLPDSLSGISSAMPQKKNFPILERIRGKTAHISAYYTDFVMIQRNTPYTNLVETAKEGGRHFQDLIDATCHTAALFTTVIRQLNFKDERLLGICTQEFFGGFSLANLLALRANIPYRTAQVLAGRYIVAMLNDKKLPQEAPAPLLQEICSEAGYSIDIGESELRIAFSIDHSLWGKCTSGSVRPSEVLSLLDEQVKECFSHKERLQANKRRIGRKSGLYE